MTDPSGYVAMMSSGPMTVIANSDGSTTVTYSGDSPFFGNAGGGTGKEESEEKKPPPPPPCDFACQQQRRSFDNCMNTPFCQYVGATGYESLNRYYEKVKEWVKGKDYSTNTFEQNFALCQAGVSLGACTAAVSQGRTENPDNPWAKTPDMGQSLKDGAKEVAIGTTLGVIGKVALVGQLGVGEVRALYLARIDQIALNANARIAAGDAVEIVAREAVSARNALKLEMRELGPWAAARGADMRNLIKYGDRAGLNAEQMYQKYGSWDAVLSAVQRSSSFFNKLVK